MSGLASPLESSDLATLIVDALLRAGVLSESEAAVALEIATGELEARKAVGDYWCANCPNVPK